MTPSAKRTSLLFILCAACVACASVEPRGAAAGTGSPTAGGRAAPNEAAAAPATPAPTPETVPAGEGTKTANGSPRGSDSTQSPEGPGSDASAADGSGRGSDGERGGAPFQMPGVPLNEIPKPPDAATEARSTGGASGSAGGGGGGGGTGGTHGVASIPHVRMFPSENFPPVGTRLSIRVWIEGASAVGSVPFHVVYNAAVLRFERGLEGPFLGGGGRQTAFFAAPMSSGSEMVVGLSRLGAGDGIGGNGELCTLDFMVVGPGDAGLEFTRANVRDPENRIVPAAFDPADVTAR